MTRETTPFNDDPCTSGTDQASPRAANHRFHNSTESGAAGRRWRDRAAAVNLPPKAKYARELLFHDAQLVRYLEDTRNAIGGDGGQVLVAFIVDDADKRHPLIVHNDVDTRSRLPEITRKRSRTGQ